MNTVWKSVLGFLGGLVLIGGILAVINIPDAPKSDLSAVAKAIQDGRVSNVVVEGTKLTATLRDGGTLSARKDTTESLSTVLSNYGVEAAKLQAVPVEVKELSGWAMAGRVILIDGLPILLMLAVGFFLLRQLQAQSGRTMSMGQSNAREVMPGEGQKTTFADVAGAREAKEELAEIVDFLHAPEKFAQLGAKIPKGVLLMGSPGTGKTLLARAVAGEARVPFLHLSGSEFMEMLVGVGASRVRDLFAKAKKHAPCIGFIDEIDAIGRQRGSGLGGSHDEREQTPNQILVEMDGFEPNNGVIVMAATNRADVLDPALLRPGRFDRRVILDLPDLRDREDILTLHAKGKPLAEGVSLRRLAERTGGFFGADLANLVNEAAILAARQGHKTIHAEMLFNAIEKVLLGPERRSHVMNADERKVTAYHEAGHALVTHLLPHTDPVQKVSIISRGRAAGYTLKTPIEDRTMRTSEEYREELAVMMGGYAAERTIFGDVTTGASNDMKNATRTARSMVSQWGMSERLGPRTYGEHEDMIFLGREIHENRDYSESKAVAIDEEIDVLIKKALDRATEIIKANRDAMDRIVAALLEKETIERDDFATIVGFQAANAKSR